MKILYVTGMCAPLKNILLGHTENEITGTPGFFHPWYKLVQRGHQVDFVIASNFNEEFNINVDWFDNRNIYANVYDPYTEVHWFKRIFRRIKRFTKLIYFTNKAIRENEYDFVYCKSVYEGLAGNLVSNIRGVPCGMRSLGTMAYSEIQNHGVLGAALRNPAEYLTFRLKKDFFLMTDDGTRGDYVYDKFRGKKTKYDFYFWKTGIELKNIDGISADIQIPTEDYIFFAARIDNWKRHDRIIHVVNLLHSKGRRLHLYFAGPVQSEEYYKSLRSLIEEHGLTEFVHFLGTLKQDEIKVLAHNAVANPLMYDHSNLGNIFFETFSIGAVIVGLNDGSLNEYLIHGENGYLVNDEGEACKIIEGLIDNKQLRGRIRNSARQCAKEKFLSIDERFDREVDLIESVVHSNRIESVDSRQKST